MAQGALPLWHELEREAGQSLLDITGGLDIGPAGKLQPIARALEACGAAFELMNHPSSRYPGVRTTHLGLFSPDTRVIAARASLSTMTKLAQARGAIVREQTAAHIEAIEDHHVTVSIDGGERLAARRCVLATGAWTSRHLRRRGINSPHLRVSREQTVYYRQLEDFPVLIDRSSEPQPGYAIPERFGSPGARVGHHMSGREVSPDDPAPADNEIVERITDFAGETLPAVLPEPIAVETCLYTTTPDEDFVIDRVGPLIIASPCSGHGFKFAPLIGEIVATLALGEPSPVDIARFRIDRQRVMR